MVAAHAGRTGGAPVAPLLSVTIVAHEARDLLRDCLRSLNEYPYTLGPMEILVLDNASGDGTLEMLADEFPEVIVLAEDVRRGFGANQNLAIDAASGELIFMLNPDALLTERTLDMLVEAVMRDGSVAAVGCRVLNTDGTPRQAWPIVFPTPTSIYRKAFGMGKVSSDALPSKGKFNDRWLSGGAMLVERDAFVGIGGFDEAFFMYAEDVDLCLRLARSGRFFAWVTDAAVVHPLPHETPASMLSRQRLIVTAELKYVRKYHGTLGEYVYRFGAILDSGIRAGVLLLPIVGRRVNVHGSTRAETRARHVARLRAALSVRSGDPQRAAAARNTTDSGH